MGFPGGFQRFALRQNRTKIMTKSKKKSEKGYEIQSIILTSYIYKFIIICTFCHISFCHIGPENVGFK